jgi:hypothetical protein
MRKLRAQLSLFGPGGTRTRRGALGLIVALAVAAGAFAGGQATAGTRPTGQKGATTTRAERNGTAAVGDAAICVLKFWDKNRNRVPDREPYLPGWTYTVTAGATIVGTLTSKKSPACLPVPAGTYDVAEALKPGWAATTSAKQTAAVESGQTRTLKFGNVTTKPAQDPCNAEEFPGQVPGGATDVSTGYANTDDPGAVTEAATPISTLYPTLDTTVDTFYGQAGACAGDTLGGTVPDAAKDPSALADELKQIGIVAQPGDLTAELGKIGDDVASTAAPLPAGFPALPTICGPAGPATKSCYVQPSTPRPLDSTKPFGGRDVIFVHGLRTGPIFAAIGGNGSAQTTWEHPADRPEFYLPTGYWKQGANAYWQYHIHRWLKGDYALNGTYSGHATNRYLVVAWPTTERLFVGAHAMLTQIKDAMVSGTGVINETGPSSAGDTGGFCSSGCVIVSHSTGGPLTDVAMSLAEATKAPGPLQTQYGNVGFVPDHIRAQIALHGAFNGSGMATPIVAAGSAIALSAPMCLLVKNVIGWFTGTSATTCSGLPVIPNSVLVDLVPAVMQALWGSTLNSTPVPTLTVAGGHPTSDGFDSSVKLGLLKVLFNPGLDDGVLTDNSQCANPNLFVGWPSGYHAVPRPLHANVFDMGIDLRRAIGFYHAQIWDTSFRPSAQISGGCTPYLSPDGMVQPVLFVNPLFSPWNRYNNHYSFLQSTSDHFIGPLNDQQNGGGAGSYIATDCYLQTEEFGGTGHVCENYSVDNNEEIRVIDDPSVYHRVCPPGVVDTGQPACAALVNPAVGGLVQREVRGHYIQFKLFHKVRRLWFWRRAYDRLTNWQAWTENDYVFKYVLR